MNSSQSRSQVAGRLRPGTPSVFRTFNTGSLFVQKQLWIWPIVAAVALGAAGCILRGWIEQSLKSDLRGKLQSLLAADVEALQLWMRSQETTVASVAADPHVIELSEKLLTIATRPETKQLELL